MGSKLIYWIPFVGVLISLVNYHKDNEMSAFWAYYQAFVTMGLIFFLTYISIKS
jgi:hypothetical protein